MVGMMYSNTLTSKGQVTIPKEFRDMLGLKPNQKVRFERVNDHTVQISRPMTGAEVRALIGPPAGDQPLTAKERERLKARGLL